jgi:hypothetical protein
MSTSSTGFLRLVSAATLLAAALTTSCTTSYDAYGRPQQTVDPGVALAGVAAAGLVGYALADNNHNHGHYNHGHYHGGYRGGYRGGHRGGYRY